MKMNQHFKVFFSKDNNNKNLEILLLIIILAILPIILHRGCIIKLIPKAKDANTKIVLLLLSYHSGPKIKSIKNGLLLYNS